MWPCLGWHGHCRAIGPVGTARHGFCLIVPCLGHHHGTLALSGTAGVPPCLPCPCLAVPCHVVSVPVPCRAARLENYSYRFSLIGLLVPFCVIDFQCYKIFYFRMKERMCCFSSFASLVFSCASSNIRVIRTLQVGYHKLSRWIFGRTTLLPRPDLDG